MLEKLEELILYSAACHNEEGPANNLFSNSIETIKKPEFKSVNSPSLSMRSKEIYDVTGIYFVFHTTMSLAFMSPRNKGIQYTFKFNRRIQSIMTAGFITDPSLKTTNNGQQYFLVSLIDHRVKTLMFLFSQTD